jgi:hypothetical protein
VDGRARRQVVVYFFGLGLTVLPSPNAFGLAALMRVPADPAQPLLVIADQLLGDVGVGYPHDALLGWCCWVGLSERDEARSRFREQLRDSRCSGRQAVQSPRPKWRATTSVRLAGLIINIGHLLSSRLLRRCQKPNAGVQ